MSVAREQHGGEADDDRFFLDQVLNKLYDFGDKHKRSKKSLKRKNVAKDDSDAEENTDTIKHDTDSEQTNSTVCENIPSGTKQSNVEVVTFINPLKRKKLSKAVEPAKKAPVVEVKKKKKVSDKKLRIEKARFEVHKFGLTGYEKQQQRVFEQERAIMLGAIPPKKQYVNYKVYQRNIRKQKRMEKAKAKSGFCQESNNKKRKAGKPRIEKSKSSSIRDLGGQVGRFKNGMLVLSSKDIPKLKVKAKK
ncbi:hypothetical protein DPX16_9023 [Anabarilius grahami]|uniref:Uncharacterized protein n=1 Tax=Anabarilius grahami TaxID=495550 RepID=A0A3N0YKG9_ANAGA|nr:hypothetical protein DPX16_9023 [Anabarilius grahami]